MSIFLYLIIGLAIGGVSGVIGIGGGVLLVPALIWLCGMEPHRAAGTTLAILIPPIGLPAAWRAYHAQQVDLAAALWIAAAFCVGAYASRGIVDYIPEFWFRLVFGVLMIFVAVRLIVFSDSEATSAGVGLTATVLVLLAYWGLKVLGRRCLPPRSLQENICAANGQKPTPDYQI